MYDHHVAQWKAVKAGAIGPVNFVKDKRGLYYQVVTIYGPYNFRVT